jgi:anti-sigma factor RsiW
VHCSEIRGKLNAWADNELPPHEADRISGHLDQCPACRREARGLQQLADIVDTLPAIQAPPGFTRNAMRAFRANFKLPGMMAWWQSLSLAMRCAVCGAALAGLLCGAVLGTSISFPGTGNQANPYQALYASKGIFP